MRPTTPEPANRDMDRVAGGAGRVKGRKGGLFVGRRASSKRDERRDDGAAKGSGISRGGGGGMKEQGAPGGGGQAAGRRRCYAAARSHGSCSFLCVVLGFVFFLCFLVDISIK